MPALEFLHLEKAYGTVRALRNTTFSVRSGEIFGFVGSNGAGKTTTMRIALGVLAADRGEVRWDGRPLDLAVRRRIGYMPEERGLYPRMKVARQLAYLARLHGMDPADAQRSADRWTEVLGVAERRDDEVQKLSLGNQQRVQLAAALVYDPDILILDEPFSGLDPVAVDVMSAVLRERAAAGVPVVFSSHQLDLVERLCDNVGIIKEGSMVAVGSIAALRTLEKPRWRIEGPPALLGWAERLDRVDVVSAVGETTVVEVHDAADGMEQAILRAALTAGPVRYFGEVHPHLVDLYRHAVSEPERDHAPDATQPPGLVETIKEIA
ncbi:MAG: ATP-binding cassette domain-containing protein [Ornithinimicrobium sp.]|uniref:ABC transporter ATP-binding protein n=1 Tax=Ornithinimicrobium sp. TaxID=1977084 RepID=UPI0026DF2C59|nr:ATP-binding cassette domain-containing protein [Ornithinimicrobium sp.]MDO5739942.1 ATP-binding cassette domain-containing protein [Ornithinimicrobium sp.]